MSGFNPNAGQPEPVVKRDHAPLNFLVAPGGYGQKWVCCPVCCAEPNGWTPDGKAIYNGGFVDVEVATPAGSLYAAVVACRCEAGRSYSERSGRGEMARFDRLPPNCTFITRPAPILWVKGKSKEGPPRPVQVGEEKAYMAAHAEQMRRMNSGLLTQEQWAENCRALDEKYLPAKLEAPSIELLLGPDGGSLRGLYFSAFGESINWRKSAEVQGPDYNERAEARREERDDT